MGNCMFKGLRDEKEENSVKVITSNGGIMELYAPITVNCITDEFPGHAIFKSRHLFSDPLLHNQQLYPGELYYLLPLNPYKTTNNNNNNNVQTTPYRMSCDNQGMLMRNRSAEPEVFPRYNNSGVWKVKLVISPGQLSEILSQETRTEQLIESVRTVAKCGNGLSSAASSDQWSVSSSCKGSL